MPVNPQDKESLLILSKDKISKITMKKLILENFFRKVESNLLF